tara:strand:+ start:61 stop:246 length:186 start_codon:yes stop_codon:yes gene_type:complete
MPDYTTMPIGGDPTDDIECSGCGNTDTIWAECGDGSSDEADLEVYCESCEESTEVDYNIEE